MQKRVQELTVSWGFFRCKMGNAHASLHFAVTSIYLTRLVGLNPHKLQLRLYTATCMHALGGNGG